MKTVKVYDEASQTWVAIGSGETGPQGPQGPKGEDYILTQEDKQEIALIVGQQSWIVSGEINSIEIVDSLPAVEQQGVLYLVKE